MGEARQLVSPARVFARPTADQIWLGPAQRAALSQLSRPTRVRLLLGPPSSGKSTLLQHWAHSQGPHVVALKCRGPKDSAGAVLAGLLVSADLGPWELSEIEQRNLFTVFVQQRRLQGRRVLLIVDDVHTFNAAALEELARLLSFNIDQRPALEIVLAGLDLQEARLDGLRAALDRAELAQHVLSAPSPHDLVSYIDWRLARFGASQQISPMASQMIARLTGGRFAAADVLCQMSLLVTRQLKLERVDARVVRQAIATLVTRQSAKLDEAGALRGELQPPVPPSGQLIISRGGKVVTRVMLGERRKTLIGRSEDNDICLKNPYLSRHHAAIVGTADGYYVVDLNSVNGVQLNGRPIDRAALCDEDVLTLGPFRLKVQMPEWLAQRGPPPEGESLDDTAVMSTPAEPPTSSTMRRVK